MAHDTHICTACGYEGRPVRAPDDSVGEDPSFLLGIAERLIFVLTFLPIKLGWVAKLAKRGKAKHCSNCGLPLMVRLSSDAGWLAKRKQEIKAGLVIPTGDAGPKVTFGKEIILPGDVVNKVEQVPMPQSLPSLNELLSDKPAPKEELVEKPVVIVTKKPVDPEQW